MEVSPHSGWTIHARHVRGSPQLTAPSHMLRVLSRKSPAAGSIHSLLKLAVIALPYRDTTAGAAAVVAVPKRVFRSYHFARCLKSGRRGSVLGKHSCLGARRVAITGASRDFWGNASSSGDRSAASVFLPWLLLRMSGVQPERQRTTSSAAMLTMGVDIRVPSDWVVASTVVEGKKCIGTHNGTFHCDEALACAMLKILPEWSDAVVVRTRDETELAKCDAVVDVGGVYNATTFRFDHHQKTFHDTLSEESYFTRLSSAGLVYRHFGRQIIKLLVEGSGVPEDVVDNKLYGKVYKNFVEHIDAIDNGVDAADAPVKYDVSTHLSARVATLNPKWNERPEADGSDATNELFKQAMSLTGGEFCSCVQGLSSSWWPGRAIVAESFAKRTEDHPSGEILVLTGYCPWKSHLLELEEEMGTLGQLKFVLYAEGDPSGKWRIQAVPKSEDSFALRMSLPKPWLGLRGEELSKASGIDGCVFVHVSGFIGGNASKSGAMAMASKALEMSAAES